jgi:hypothetical protein
MPDTQSISGGSQAVLMRVFATLPPHELKGTALLREHRIDGDVFPADVPRDELREAVAEMVAYAEASRAAARRLSDLRPVPLTGIDLAFGL